MTDERLDANNLSDSFITELFITQQSPFPDINGLIYLNSHNL